MRFRRTRTFGVLTTTCFLKLVRDRQTVVNEMSLNYYYRRDEEYIFALRPNQITHAIHANSSSVTLERWILKTKQKGVN